MISTEQAEMCPKVGWDLVFNRVLRGPQIQLQIVTFSCICSNVSEVIKLPILTFVQSFHHLKN